MSDIKKAAHNYSIKFINRKTMAPRPDLALAFEAGAEYMQEEIQTLRAQLDHYQDVEIPHYIKRRNDLKAQLAIAREVMADYRHLPEVAKALDRMREVRPNDETNNET